MDFKTPVDCASHYACIVTNRTLIGPFRRHIIFTPFFIH